MNIEFNEYDKILIGIGDDFSVKEPENIENIWDKLIYVEENVDFNILDAYNHLASKIKELDYFVVSTCNDDAIYKSNLNKSKIVTPCGGFRYLQCANDCSHELLPYEKSFLDSREELRCPHCGEKVVFNRLPIDHYNEGGYMDAWQEYNKWLQSTINKKLLILEVGVGMKYPTVIRFPFEKTAFYNQKSVMYRVHETLAFSTDELKDRCICVKGNPIEFLNNL